MKRLTFALLEQWLSDTQLETMDVREHWEFRGKADKLPVGTRLAWSPGCEACVGHFLIVPEGPHWCVYLDWADLDYYKTEAIQLLNL